MNGNEPTVTTTLVGALPAGTTLHEYRIERVLGHGGFGITYLAHDTHLDKRVAIKEYLPNDLAARGPQQTVAVRSPEAAEAFRWGRESFVKEARVLAKFSHPSLIQVHRFFEANETAYFVMEYAEGVTLAAVLKQEGSMSEERLRKILFPVLNGLAEVHKAGVLHRDIKPDNIVLRDGTQPVLIDFGAARQSLSSMTRSIMSVLTAGYAPIEQYASTGNQGPWTDLYALGAVAYRAISGKKPVDAVNRIREDPMVPASVIGQGRYAPHFLAAIDWALTVNPEDRPNSVAHFALALDGELVPPVASPAPAAGHALAAARSHASSDDRTVINRTGLAAPRASAAWIRWVAFAGVALAALALVVVLTRPKPPELVTATQPPAQPAPQTAVRKAESGTTQVAPPAGAEAEKQEQEQEPPPEPQARTKPAPRTTTPRRKITPVAKMAPLATFQDCASCPAMVPLAAGSYVMGAQPADNGNAWEGPAHRVTLAKPFAIARHEVTVGEWQACVKAGACAAVKPGPTSGDPARAPVVNVTWADTQAYLAWLGKTTGRTYRLPTEAEWEYAIRARTTSARYWGGDRTQQCRYGNGADKAALKFDRKLPAVECNDGHAVLAPVGAFQPNAFGLHDMAGNAWEWTQDCWRDTYNGAPADGRAVQAGDCERRVIRGGSWRARPNSLRSFGRGNSPPGIASDDLGFRVVAE